MSCSTTTGFSEMRHADSDSVNLGSNPSPPATEILEKSGDLGAGQVGQDSHDAPDGRTRPGTVTKRTHDLLDSVEAKFPNDQQIAGRIRIVRHQLRLKAGGDDSPELQAGINRTLVEIGDLIAVARGHGLGPVLLTREGGQ
jgi:hypothetical protein